MVKGKVLVKLNEKIPESNEKLLAEIENKPLAEYKETLYTESNKPKKEAYAFSDQRMWRNVAAIEKNVDTIDVNKKPSDDLNRIVDNIIAKKKK